MTTLVGVTTDLRALFAAHIPLEFVNWRRLRPADDRERYRLMGVAAKAAHFQIGIAPIEGVTESRRGLGGAPVAEHPHVPCFAGQTIGFPPGFGSTLSRLPDRAAIDVFARFGGHHRQPNRKVGP